MVAYSKELLPLIQQRRGIFRKNLRRGRELRQMYGSLAAFNGGQILPYFVGGEAEDRGDEADERLSDLPQHRLRGAALLACRRKGVHAVLQNIEIERAQVH